MASPDQSDPSQENVRRLTRGVFVGVGICSLLGAIYGYVTTPWDGKVWLADALGGSFYYGQQYVV